MKARFFILISLLFINVHFLSAQDTFSIVALDPITGEVGSAGASCVDLMNFPNMTDHFLGELFPGIGAINCQAYYLASNQANARARMNEGLTPSEIIDWLVDNDVQNNPHTRQYGIVALVDGLPESAGYTGSSTDDYKNHITGPNYSIQGNILLGQVVLDSMEAKFNREPGDLACKLMAALQGANMVGADSRCASNGTSSLFAFVKVAQPEDVFGSPSFIASVRTQDNAGIEPIDSLQIIFDDMHYCPTVSIQEQSFEKVFSISPNPVSDVLKVQLNVNDNYHIEIIDVDGNIINKSKMADEFKLNVTSFKKGMYFIRVFNENNSYTEKFMKL